MDKKTLEKVVATALLPYGFRKKSSTWYRERQEALHIIDLQKSVYGNQFYLNICFVPAGMTVEGFPTPKENKCPIRIRLTTVFPNEQAKFNELFDIDNNEIADSARTLSIENLFESFVIPFISKVEKEGLKSAVEGGYFDGGAVNLAAKKYLQSDRSPG